jgi:hypothetical protein
MGAGAVPGAVTCLSSPVPPGLGLQRAAARRGAAAPVRVAAGGRPGGEAPPLLGLGRRGHAARFAARPPW